MLWCHFLLVFLYQFLVSAHQYPYQSSRETASKIDVKHRNKNEKKVSYKNAYYSSKIYGDNNNT